MATFPVLDCIGSLPWPALLLWCPVFVQQPSAPGRWPGLTQVILQVIRFCQCSCQFFMSFSQVFGNWSYGTIIFTVLVFTVTLKVSEDLSVKFWEGVTRTVAKQALWTDVLLFQSSGFTDSNVFDDTCLVLARSGHAALDVDQPSCYLGVPGFLRYFQLFLGWNNMVG